MGGEDAELAKFQAELDAARAALKEANAHLQAAIASYRRSKVHDEDSKERFRAAALLASAATERCHRALGKSH